MSMEGSHLIVSFVILVVIDDHDLNPLKTPNGSSFYPCVFVSWNTSKRNFLLATIWLLSGMIPTRKDQHLIMPSF